MPSPVYDTAVAIRDLGLLATDMIAKAAPRVGRQTSGSSSDEDRLLIVRLDAIGDFVVWLDAARGIRDHYASSHITLVGNALWCDLAERLPYFDRVIPVDPSRYRHNIKYRLRKLNAITRSTYRRVLNVAYRREGRFADAESIVRAASAREKISPTPDPYDGWRQRWSESWYTDVLPVSTDAMELKRNASFVRALGASNFQARVPRIPVETLPDVSELPSAYYVLFPGAGAAHRRWPLDRLATIAERVYRRTGWTGVICGGPQEKSLGQTLKSQSTAPLENWVGRTSVSELVSVLSQARIVVGNETSAVHIAAAVSTPSVCILGGGHYGRFVPYDVENPPTDRPVPKPVTHKMQCFNCNWDCHFDVPEGTPTPCLDRIPTDAVWQGIEDVLADLDGVSRPSTNLGEDHR